MLKELVKPLAVAIAFLGVAMAFQNCSPGGLQGNTTNSSSVPVDSDRDSHSEPIPATLDGASAPLKGQIYGSCSMQLDGSFAVAHNGLLDANGNKLTNVPAGIGGATYPVTKCPNSGAYTKIECAAGYKPVQVNLAQMDCRTSDAAALCKTYWLTYGCVAL